MNKLGLILVCILILALAYFVKIGVNEKPDRLIRHVEVISPKQKDIYKVGDTITIHLSNPSDIPKDSLQLVFIVGENNGFTVKSCINSLYCAYPDSDLVAYGQSGEFTIASSYQ